MAKRRWFFPSLVQADRFLLNQIPSLVLQNTREFPHLWERPQEDTKDNAATAVTHSRESGTWSGFILSGLTDTLSGLLPASPLQVMRALQK